MIKELQLKSFKKFKDKRISLLLTGVSVLAGGNNSGKSSILHALAIWEFCKNYLINQKGRKAILNGFKGDGIGISIDDFTPINIPSLIYLWTNLKPSPSYSLSINCIWDTKDKENCQLEIGLALTQDRLYIKSLSSNLDTGDYLPVIAYIPPFAGITDKEPWYSPADRNKLIGRGLAGAVLRNTIIEMNNDQLRLRDELRGSKKKLTSKDYAILRVRDPLEHLNRVLQQTFQIQLFPHHFNPGFHNYVRVDVCKGEFKDEKFSTYKTYTKRDIMVEGSGFLQWLSVYTFALNEKVDILLLDEPDAHLHSSLQTLLLEKLVEISLIKNKQVLLASHSTEIIKYIAIERLLEVKQNSISYLTKSSQRVALLAGIGSEYSPKINQLQVFKKLLFVENESDVAFLRSWAKAFGLNWPNNLVVWPIANKHTQRKQLFIHLSEEIPSLQAISLVDRDTDHYNTTSANLVDNNLPNCTLNGASLRFRKWRRLEIENYLICPPAIARAAKCSEDEIASLLLTEFCIVVHPSYISSDKTPHNSVLFDLDGKDVIAKVETSFKINKHQISSEMESAEVPEDVKTLINEIILICQ